jgi:hypothetical protein
LTAVALVGQVLFPPFHFQHPRGVVFNLGYAPIWDAPRFGDPPPPQRSSAFTPPDTAAPKGFKPFTGQLDDSRPRGSVNVLVLALQLLVTVIVGVLLIWVVAKR